MDKIIKKLYEVEWVENENNNTLEIKLWPIYVVREDILPGCSAVSITAIDKNGLKFIGSPRNYYKTEQDALEAAKEELIQSLINLGEDQRQIKKDIERFEQCLNNL